MKGYYKKPEMTKEVIDDGKYLHTGDLGYCDKNGKFYIVDRIKELIKVQGFQVNIHHSLNFIKIFSLMRKLRLYFYKNSCNKQTFNKSEILKFQY